MCYAGVDFKYDDFSGKDLKDETYYTCYFNNADFRGANLSDIVFEECGFKFACFQDASLTNVTFKDCYMGCVNFKNANFNNVRFNDCHGITDRGLRTTGEDFIANFEGTIYGGLENKELLLKIRDLILEDEDKLNMDVWEESCGTSRCLTGWAVELHPKGRELQKTLGYEGAGLVLLGKEASKYFFEPEDKVLEWLEELE